MAINGKLQRFWLHFFCSIEFVKTKLLNRTNPSNVIIGIVPIIDKDEIEDVASEGKGHWSLSFDQFSTNYVRLLFYVTLFHL